MKPFDFEDINLNKINFSTLQINEKIPLGKRVERFFEFYIQNSNRYELTNHNIQIIEDKNTIGEIDFIIKDIKKDKYKHIELVYKCYLYDDSCETELERYIGPNRDDTLIKKLTKLESKQFPLLYHPITKKYLKDIDIDEVGQELCLFANIFLPKRLYDVQLPLINNSAIKGFYIDFEEFKQDEYKTLQYHLPHRYDWVTIPNANYPYISYAEVFEEVEYFIKFKKSSLIWMKEGNTYKRFFITLW
jgi:hypothetical protein